MSKWQKYLEQNQARYLAELVDFLKIPSISSLPEHSEDIKQAAEWVKSRMAQAGIENLEILPTGGHPVVYGDWLHGGDAPTILIYGHFDVQPVDPLNLWQRPPFEPVISEDRIYARGATDDKGNMFVPILAVEALLQSEGKLPVNLKFLFEGQEEIGSPQLPEFMAAQAARYACDLVVSSDGGQWREDQPALLVGSKGLCALQIDVLGANSDLHSGIYGGTIQNPIHALTAIVASMRDTDGKILVPGFYEAVRPLSDSDRAQFAAVPYDEADYLGTIGLSEPFGEPGYTTYERGGGRPTLEVNGIWGGFQGDGVKTVLPNAAHAKITCRLVTDQDPTEIYNCIKQHIENVAPVGVTVNVSRNPSTAYPYLMPPEHPANQLASSVLQELYGKEPYYVRTGGSVPLYTLFKEHLGVYSLTFAFGLEDENLHAPNEFYRLASFRRGQRAYCLLLYKLAELGS